MGRLDGVCRRGALRHHLPHHQGYEVGPLRSRCRGSQHRLFLHYDYAGFHLASTGIEQLVYLASLSTWALAGKSPSTKTQSFHLGEDMFLETTPNISGYMIAGYVVVFTVMAIYLFSIYIRNRNLKQDLETLESLQAEKPKAVQKKSKKK